jgi:chloramphenicol 3-O phosphotransferase
MNQRADPGQIVILNGVPRSGKSSIVKVIQATFEGVWMNLGVDVFARRVTPERYQPGIGLRPGPGPQRGGDRPDLEPLVPTLFAAVYESIAAHSRLGLNVVSDFGHHGAIHPHLLRDCARRLDGLPVLFVGVRCPVDVIMERRNATWGRPDAAPAGTPVESMRSYEARRAESLGTADDPIPAPVLLWQEEVHKPGIYDMEVDTSALSPEQCAEAIRKRLEEGPPGDAFCRLADARDS